MAYDLTNRKLQKPEPTRVTKSPELVKEHVTRAVDFLYEKVASRPKDKTKRASKSKPKHKR
jgi:hypothetical protein